MVELNFRISFFIERKESGNNQIKRSSCQKSGNGVRFDIVVGEISG